MAGLTQGMPRELIVDALGHHGQKLPEYSGEAEHEYAHSMNRRQVQMIAIGGAIGVGLFMGAGSRLHNVGPALVLSYAFAGFIAWALMRALGELVMYHPTSGSFVFYAKDLFSERAAYFAGWMYFVNWATTGIAELTAVAQYMNFWWPSIPQWVTALCALGIVLAVNLTSVKAFAEFEFWASVLKVLALVLFLIVGTVLVVMGTKVGDTTAGWHHLSDHGGFFPAGFAAAFIVLNGVIFAYSAVEMVGITAGEMQDARTEVPRAVKAVTWRIGIFYVGSVFLLAMLLPYTEYVPKVSPFVTVFDQLGIHQIAGIMNLVVITAALSSCNSGLYATSRTLKAMADRGHAPRILSRMSGRRVPMYAIAMICVVYLLGVLLNYKVPEDAFEIALEMGSIGVIWTWMTIFACQLKFRYLVSKEARLNSPFPAPGFPVLSAFCILALAAIVATMWEGDPGRYVLMATPVLLLAMFIGWIAIQKDPRQALALRPAGSTVADQRHRFLQRTLHEIDADREPTDAEIDRINASAPVAPTDVDESKQRSAVASLKGLAGRRNTDKS